MALKQLTKLLTLFIISTLASAQDLQIELKESEYVKGTGLKMALVDNSNSKMISTQLFAGSHHNTITAVDIIFECTDMVICPVQCETCFDTKYNYQQSTSSKVKNAGGSAKFVFERDLSLVGDILSDKICLEKDVNTCTSRNFEFLAPLSQKGLDYTNGLFPICPQWNEKTNFISALYEQKVIDDPIIAFSYNSDASKSQMTIGFIDDDIKDNIQSSSYIPLQKYANSWELDLEDMRLDEYILYHSSIDGVTLDPNYEYLYLPEKVYNEFSQQLISNYHFTCDQMSYCVNQSPCESYGLPDMKIWFSDLEQLYVPYYYTTETQHCQIMVEQVPFELRMNDTVILGRQFAESKNIIFNVESSQIAFVEKISSSDSKDDNGGDNGGSSGENGGEGHKTGDSNTQAAFLIFMVVVVIGVAVTMYFCRRSAMKKRTEDPSYNELGDEQNTL